MPKKPYKRTAVWPTSPISKPTKRPSTLNRGASDDRAAIKAYTLTMPTMTVITQTDAPEHTWGTTWIKKSALIDFIDGMAARADHRKGGRGRKYPVKPKGKPKQRPAGDYQ